jgi:hypothetical protein
MLDHNMNQKNKNYTYSPIQFSVLLAPRELSLSSFFFFFFFFFFFLCFFLIILNKNCCKKPCGSKYGQYYLPHSYYLFLNNITKNIFFNSKIKVYLHILFHVSVVGVPAFCMFKVSFYRLLHSDHPKHNMSSLHVTYC